MKEFKYEIIKHFGTVSSSANGDNTLEVNLISYNGAEPKIDIRRWNRATDKMLKGITLSKEEVEALKKILQVMETE
jgi:hypothetical protein